MEIVPNIFWFSIETNNSSKIRKTNLTIRFYYGTKLHSSTVNTRTSMSLTLLFRPNIWDSLGVTHVEKTYYAYDKLTKKQLMMAVDPTDVAQIAKLTDTN